MAWHFAQSPVPFVLVRGQSDSFAATPEAAEKPMAAKEIAETPSATVFAGKGDRLSDLSEALLHLTNAGAGSWLVWNETRHLLIAHGDASVLFDVEQRSGFSSQPQVAALTLDWYQGLNPDVTAKPFRRLAIQGRSGKPLSSGWEDNPETPVPAGICSVHFTGESQLGGTIGMDTRFTLQWTERADGKDWRWSMESAVSMEGLVSKPLVLVRASSPSGGDWTIVARSGRKLIDGSLWSEARWTEEAGKAVAILPWRAEDQILSRAPVVIEGRKFKVRSYRVGSDFFPSLSSAGSSPSSVAADPFEAATEIGSSPAETLPEGTRALFLPAQLRAEIPGPLADVKEMLRRCGVLFSDGEFAGYDPLGRVLHVVSASDVELDKIEQLISVCCVLPPRNVAIGLRVARQGEVVIPQRELTFTTRFGQRAILTCQQENHEPFLKWVIEPTIGSSDFVDLLQECRLPASMAGSAVETSGSTTLASGVVQPFQAHETSGTKTTLSLRAEVSSAQ